MQRNDYNVMENFRWIPFVETLQKIENTYYYATKYGGNIVKVKDGKYTILFKGEYEESIVPFHFSIVFGDYILFFPSNTIEVLELNTMTFEVKRKTIINGKNEVYMPMKVGFNRLEAIGCISMKRYVYEENAFRYIDKLSDNEGWGARRTKVNTDTICMWNNAKHVILVYKVLSGETINIEIKGIDISAVIEDNGMIYIATMEGNIIIYDIRKNMVETEIEIFNDNIIQKIVIFENEIFCFADKGNKVVVINKTNVCVKNIEIEIEERDNTSWVEVTDDTLVCLVESSDFSSAMVMEYSMKNKKLKKHYFLKAYSDYKFNEENGLKENMEFGLVNLIGKICEKKDIEKN